MSNPSLFPDHNCFMTSQYPAFALSANRLKATTGQIHIFSALYCQHLTILELDANALSYLCWHAKFFYFQGQSISSPTPTHPWSSKGCIFLLLFQQHIVHTHAVVFIIQLCNYLLFYTSIFPIQMSSSNSRELDTWQN